jgi:NAD(P)-dependent dehydrogenase (short-subunit alcohol dehydrogenase family)
MDRRVALVTGCGKADGIGAATARALAAAGISVVASDVTESGRANALGTQPAEDRAGLAALIEEIERAGGLASWTCGDVTVEADASRMVRDCLDRYGRLDILVNNAGAPHGADRADIQQVSLQAWEDVMAVNVRGAFLLSRAAVGPMRRQGEGRIVNVASAIVKYPRPNRVAYTTSKAALIGFTESLAIDLASDAITVNAVCPGSTATSRFYSSATRAGFKDMEVALAETSKGVPLGRHGSPEDMAGAIVFLSSKEASYITGHALFVDGGGLPQYKV